MSQPNCLIIAGEKSGEEHAMSFVPEIIEHNPNIQLWGVGGEQLKNIGVEILYDLHQFSGMGFSEIIGKIGFYFKAFRHILREVKKRKTQYAILIDFQEFNYWLAKYLKKNGVQVFYYVAPQAWAWRRYRAKGLAKTVNTLFTIIPFEKKWFKERGLPSIIGVEHPALTHHRSNLSLVENKNSWTSEKRTLRLLYLPGSRKSELKFQIREFSQSIEKLRERYQVETGLVKATGLDDELFKEINRNIDCTWEDKNLPKALAWADLSVATSGTITLINALYQVPTVVCYSSSLFNEFVYYSFIKYSGPVSLANIVLQKRIFPELLQNQMSWFNINYWLEKWIDDPEHFARTVEQLRKTKDLLSGDGVDVAGYINQKLEDC